MKAAGVPAAALSRSRGPVGLIASARDPGTLAVSVLATAMALPDTATVGSAPTTG